MQVFHQIFRKEFNGFFASPAAWLFMGAFLIATFFIFFWAEAFFARNIADLKPLFEWMPVLLVFLVSTLSMRTWSEELRSGTIETLLTSPVDPGQLILGKFSANLALVALALALTVPLPITVALMGPLDWGPVIGGYVASLFLAAAYIAIGLYMSSRTDNPIVALILTAGVAGAFYLVGSSLLTTLVGHRFAGVLELLGSGSRFNSITRGVLDLRDIYYYLSIVGVFLALNRFSLEKIRWAGNPSSKRHFGWIAICGLLVLNLLAVNFWLQPIRLVRIDLTKGNAYTLSDATRGYLDQAVEPLLLRGYFSQKSHPLLEPLIPRLKDLLEEYQAVGGERIRVEFVDPHSDQSIESEAADKYGIRPVPFRMASRYEAGVVNSYFDLLVAYGDQHETLSFDDLIEVKSSGSGEPEVLLKNPEYVITRAVRKLMQRYRAGGDILAELQNPVTLRAYVSPAEKLPGSLADLRGELKTLLQEMGAASGGNLEAAWTDPESGGEVLMQQLNQRYGFVPQMASLFDRQTFWFYLVLESGETHLQVPLPEELSKNQLRQSIEGTLQRLQPGYLKTIGLIVPEGPPRNPNPYMPPPPAGKEFNRLREALEANSRIVEVDVENGVVSSDVDLLLVLAPGAMNQKELFAVDQFLMQGGTVVVARSPYEVSLSRTLSANAQPSGIDDWLSAMGLSVREEFVLDPQHASLAVPVPRRVGPVTVNEIVKMPYPHFPEVRSNGLDRKHPVTAALNQLTLNWVSPLEIDLEKNANREVVQLVRSSSRSWTSSESVVMPDYQTYPNTGFVPGLARAQHTLVAASQGYFDSYFKGQDSPLIEAESETQETDPTEEATDKKTEEEEEALVVSSVIQRSSDSARLVLIGSNSFAEDTALQLLSQSLGTEYTAPLELMQNIVDWSLDDAGLVAMRGRTQLARTLEGLEEQEKRTAELSNYSLALGGLGFLWLLRHYGRQRRRRYEKSLLAEISTHE